MLTLRGFDVHPRTAARPAAAAAAVGAALLGSPALGQESCGPGAGCCFEPDGTPGCDGCNADPGCPLPDPCDPFLCCQLVCAQDAFCCDVAWDTSCVQTAGIVGCPGFPEGCGAPNAGDCFQAGGNGTPYCNIAECCNTVCAQDPFCCATTWDGICANEALQLCNCTPADVPANDLCANAIEVFLGDTVISNACAAAQSPSHETCTDLFLIGLGNDVWYRFDANYTGDLLVSTCEGKIDPTWNIQLAVYEGGDCQNLSDPPLGCSQLGPGCGDGAAAVLVPVTNGETYLIRVGSEFDGPTGEFATLTLDTEAPFCSIDSSIPPQAMDEGESCDADTNGGCNFESSSTCCSDQNAPGCDTQACMNLVCFTTPACCVAEWDEACADLAHDLCPVCPHPLTSTAVGQIVHGTAWADGGQRDTDWYELQVTQSTEVTLVIEAEFAFVCGFVQQAIPGSPSCAGSTGDIAPVITGPGCEEMSLTSTIPAGTHWIFVAVDGFSGVPCPAGAAGGLIVGNDYVLRIEGAAPCPGDTDADGTVDVADLVNVITTWGTSGQGLGFNADVNGDGVVSVADMTLVITNWGPCL